MNGIVDYLGLFAGMRSPQQENHRRLLVIQLSYNRIGKNLPAHPLVRGRLPLPHGQHRVQQQHPLPRPRRQLSA